MNAIQSPVLPYHIPDYVRVFSAINNQRQRVGNARFTYDLIGRGLGRVVFDLNDGSVLKLAYNRRGIAQNKAESEPCLAPYYDSLPVPVLASDRAGKWVIQPRITLLHVAGFYEFARSNEGKNFCQKAHRFAQLHGLDYHDLTKPGSIGFTVDKYLIFDYGLTKAVWDKYYR